MVWVEKKTVFHQAVKIIGKLRFLDFATSCKGWNEEEVLLLYNTEVKDPSVIYLTVSIFYFFPSQAVK